MLAFIATALLVVLTANLALWGLVGLAHLNIRLADRLSRWYHGRRW